MRLNGYYRDSQTQVEDYIVCLMNRNRDNLGIVYNVNIQTGEHTSSNLNIIDVETQELHGQVPAVEQNKSESSFGFDVPSLKSGLKLMK